MLITDSGDLEASAHNVANPLISEIIEDLKAYLFQLLVLLGRFAKNLGATMHNLASLRQCNRDDLA
jgi:hypothetical protein